MAKRIYQVFLDFLPRIMSILALLILVFLLGYTYLLFFKIPYYGLLINYTNAQIDSIILDSQENNPFEIGDVIIAIKNRPFLSNLTNTKDPLFPNISHGEKVVVTVLRDGQERKLEWVIPGFNIPEFLDRIKSGLYIGYIFWFVGTLTLLLVRPRDIRWHLFILFCYIITIWITAGVVSFSGLWNSSRIMHATAWLVLAISLHFHWMFPIPLSNRSFPFPLLLYGTCFLLAIAEWFQWLPYQSYLIAISLAFFGSFVLIALHLILVTPKNNETRIFVTLLILLLLAVIEISVLLTLNGIFLAGSLVLALLSFLPIVYFILIYSGQSPGLRVRRNANFNRFFYYMVVSILAMSLVILFSTAFKIEISKVFMVVGISIIFGILVLYTRPYFSTWFNNQFLGIQTPSNLLIQQTTTRLANSLEMEGFVNFLKEKIFPSLLIREVLIVQLPSSTDNIKSPGYKIIMSMGVNQNQLPSIDEVVRIANLSHDTNNPVHPNNQLTPDNWWYLSLPLSFNNEYIGVSLFGSHDPDDIYTPDEIRLLEAILNHLSFAIVHTKQTEQLRAFYFNDVQRMEEERYHLARELHDDILGQLAILIQKFFDQNISIGQIQSIQGIIHQIRQIILGLRTSALNYGLKSALDDLVDQLLDQYENTQSLPECSIEVLGDGCRYPPEVELNIYRIVQQACQNSIIHAHPKSITITGHLSENELKIQIKDDGRGFQFDSDPDLENLLSGGHFGLVGMHERAAFINAKLGIQSTPENGTKVEIQWRKPG